MLYRCLLHDYLNLNMCQGCLIDDLLFFYTICFPHISLVSTSCSKSGIFMWFLLSTYYFLIDTFLIPHGLQIYIVVDTVLYLYALPIDYLSYSFSSLCLSCNLSQAHNKNTIHTTIIVESIIYFFLYYIQKLYGLFICVVLDYKH